MSACIKQYLVCCRAVTNLSPLSSQLLSNISKLQIDQQRFINKHWDPKFKRQRREKYLKTPLPKFQDMYRYMANEITPAEIRALMRQRGAIPYHPNAPLIHLSNSYEVFDAYVPSDNIGMLKSSMNKTVKKARDWKQLREIRKYEQSFDINTFPELAQDLYMRAHQLLPRVFPRTFLQEERGDDDELFELHDTVTEHCYPQLTDGLKDKTLVWQFVESLEAPEVVNVVCQEAKKEDNRYAQITVRFHNKQIMAIYDRFGRLMYGSPTVPKDVLDYIVFEKHISDHEGQWRMHAKMGLAVDENTPVNFKNLAPRTMVLGTPTDTSNKTSGEAGNTSSNVNQVKSSA